MTLPAFRSFATLASLTAFVPLALASSAVFTACSSSPSSSSSDTDGGSCQPFVPPATFSPTSPTVSFTTDVLPIFEASCAFSSCHGSPSAPQAGMYLGTDAAKTYANIVNVTSTEYPSMVRVKPGDTANSYLLHRIDNDACTLSGCTSTACAELMPQGNSTTLPEAQLLAIRGWIAQGALSDVPDAGPVADAGTGSDAETSDGASATDASGD